MSADYPPFIQEELDKMKISGGVNILHDAENTYVLLALGERRTGGYRIKVLDAQKRVEGDQEWIDVKAKEIRPQPGEMVIQVLTYPVAVYQLPKTDLPIKVEWVRG